jgi:hypothetical protein
MIPAKFKHLGIVTNQSNIHEEIKLKGLLVTIEFEIFVFTSLIEKCKIKMCKIVILAAVVCGHEH